jgi:hypothetical protein
MREDEQGMQHEWGNPEGKVHLGKEGILILKK